MEVVFVSKVLKLNNNLLYLKTLILIVEKGIYTKMTFVCLYEAIKEVKYQIRINTTILTDINIFNRFSNVGN